MATRLRACGKVQAGERVSEGEACRLDQPGEVSVATGFAVRCKRV
jgi:hypothetical protein